MCLPNVAKGDRCDACLRFCGLICLGFKGLVLKHFLLGFIPDIIAPCRKKSRVHFRFRQPKIMPSDVRRDTVSVLFSISFFTISGDNETDMKITTFT